MLPAELLDQVRQLAAQRLLTREQLLAAYESGQETSSPAQPTGRRVSVAEILYYLGGVIVFLGIGVLVSQNWDALSPLTQIVATLGSGVAAFITGVLLTQYERTDRPGQAFYFLSALLMPLGLFVTFDHAGLNVASAGVQSLLSGTLLALFLASRFLLRQKVFTVFSVFFGTWLFYSFASWMVVSATRSYETLRFYEYLTLVTGLSYLFLGFFFTRTEEAALSEPLYVFGLLGFFSSALALGGWTPNQNVLWEVAFPGIVFGVIFLSIPLKSRAFLAFGSLFLMIYILKITAEYFSGSFGWPLSLVIAGLALIGIGYLTFHLNKKYLSKARMAV